MTTPLRLPDAFTPGRTRAAAATPTCCCCCCCCAVSVAATSVALPMGFLADTAGKAGAPPERDRSARRFAAAGLALLPAAVIFTAFVLANGSLAWGPVLSVFGGLIAAGAIGASGGSGARVNGIMRYLCGVLAVMVELVLGLPILGMLAPLPGPLALTLYLTVAVAVAVLVARIYARRLRR